MSVSSRHDPEKEKLRFSTPVEAVTRYLGEYLLNMAQALDQSQDEIEKQKRKVEEKRYDELTGLLRKSELPGEIEKAIDRGNPFAVIALDLDKFKDVNDGHGHPMGDKVLAAFGDFIKHEFERENDVLGIGKAVRTGGDEFVIVADLKLTDKREDKNLDVRAQDVVQHFKKQTADLMSTLDKDVQDIALGASVGVVTWEPGNSASPDELIALSDERMYKDKENSR